MEKAKLFLTDQSQAVRLPKEFRFEVKAVRIRRRGAAVILEPTPAGWAWLDALTGPVDTDFIKAVAEQPEIAALPDLDRLLPE